VIKGITVRTDRSSRRLSPAGCEAAGVAGPVFAWRLTPNGPAEEPVRRRNGLRPRVRTVQHALDGAVARPPEHLGRRAAEEATWSASRR
jgi:hypothetical protein